MARNTDHATWITNPVAPRPRGGARAPRVWHPSHGWGEVVCATSAAPWGAPRVIVAWDDGTQGAACEADLSARAPRP